MRMIKAHTTHDTHVIGNADDMTDVTRAMAVTDIAIVRQGGEDGMRQMRQIAEFSRVKWVLDIDDNIELISPYSEHYSEYGTTEFVHAGKKIWQDGRKGFNPEANQARVDSLLVGMQEADLVTVTTERLAEYARQYNDNVAVLPNFVDTTAWWKLPLSNRKTLRVGWSGGVSHYEDWYTIREPLNRLLRKYPDVTLVSVGAHFPGILDEDLRHRVEVHPWVSFQAHSYRMMCLALDIAIIPLADLPFNHYKSPIKFLEMSAMGVASVVANVTPYKEAVISEQTALTYRNAEAFEHQLERLIKEEKLRKQIANQAYEWVRDTHDAGANAHLWTDAYASLLT